MNEEQRENVKILIALRNMYNNDCQGKNVKIIDDIIIKGITSFEKNIKQLKN